MDNISQGRACLAFNIKPSSPSKAVVDDFLRGWKDEWRRLYTRRFLSIADVEADETSSYDSTVNDGEVQAMPQDLEWSVS